jgi:NADH-quinone oxidoreductase subunit H
MKFGLLFLSEFSNTFIFSALIVTLFFGGWNLLPFVPSTGFGPFWQVTIFMAKTYFVIFLLMAVRGTLPRVRVDQMLALGWKFLLPCSIAWVMVTAFVMKVGTTLVGPR